MMIDVYYFDKEVKKGEFSNIHKLKEFPIWLDIVKISHEELKIIEEEFKLHPLTAEDLINSNTRIKVEEFNEYLFSVFYGFKNVRGSVEVFEMDFIIGDNFIISNHKVKINSFEEFKSNSGKLNEKFKLGVEFIFQSLYNQEVDEMVSVLGIVDKLIEDVEEEVVRKVQKSTLSKILRLKRKIVNFRRIAFQQREKTGFLAKNDYKHLSKKSLPYFRDVYDHMVNVSDSLDNYREAISSSYEAYMSAISNNMNEVMKILSIFATISLPLSVLSGIYGTNFDILPGQHFKYGFYLMIGIMILIIAIMLLVFKRRKWI